MEWNVEEILKNMKRLVKRKDHTQGSYVSYSTKACLAVTYNNRLQYHEMMYESMTSEWANVLLGKRIGSEVMTESGEHIKVMAIFDMWCSEDIVRERAAA